MAIVKYIKLSLMDLTVGFIGLVFILVAFGVSIHVTSASVASPSYELPTSNVEDPRSDAYDGCISGLTDTLPEEKAASACFDYVYRDNEDKSDLLSQESSPASSQKMAPEGDETKSSEEGEDDNKNSYENEEQVTEDEKDANDAETDKSDESDEPEDKIMIIEGGKKVAEY